MNVEEIKKLTQEALGPDHDVSYITEELLKKSSDPEELVQSEKDPWVRDGHFLTAVSGGGFKWLEQCTPDKWLYWRGNVNIQNIGTCGPGVSLFRFTARP